MKRSIHLLSILLIGFITSVSLGQTREEISVPLSNPGEDGKLTVYVNSGSITVEAHSSNDVKVVATRTTKKTSKKKEKGGLRRVGDNSLSFTVEEFDNQVKVRHSASVGTINYIIKVPKNFSVNLKTVNNGFIKVNGLDGTHEVSNTNGPVTMTNVGGSVIADALNDDIIVTFSRVFSDTAMMFSGLNGDIDVTFPSDIKATIYARTDNGDVYTDFEMTTSKSGQRTERKGNDGVYRVTQEKGITGDINGGGIEIGFKTLNGDILIRSK